MMKFDQELVSGHILRSVWKLMWPIVLLQLINGANQFVDHILVGHYVASDNNAANAAIGISWQYFLVVVVFIASFMQGMNVLVSRYTGRQDSDAIGRVVFQTILCACIMAVFFVAPFGYFITPSLLRLANAAPEVQVHAIPYMRIMFVFSITSFSNFLVIQVFQAIGRPKIPLVLGIFATILNISISAVLIVGAGPFPAMGAAGAALGTCLSAIPNAFIAVYIIASGKTVIRLPARLHFIPDRRIVKEIMRIGLPTGLQAILLNIGGAILISFIGLLPDSTAAQAAYTICYAQLFSLITWVSFGVRGACATLMGQNIGAGVLERGKTAVQVAAALGGCWAVLLGFVFFFSPSALLIAFDATNEPVLTYATTLLQYLAFSGFFLATTLAFTGGMQGAGDTMTPMVIAFVTQIGVLLGICVVALALGRLSTNVVWAAILTSHVSRWVLTLGAFRYGRWRRIRVGLDG